MIPTILQIIRHDRDDGSRPRWDVYLVGGGVARDLTASAHQPRAVPHAPREAGPALASGCTRENRNQWHGAVATALRDVR